jgi:hypothetical protein
MTCAWSTKETQNPTDPTRNVYFWPGGLDRHHISPCWIEVYIKRSVGQCPDASVGWWPNGRTRLELRIVWKLSTMGQFPNALVGQWSDQTKAEYCMEVQLVVRCPSSHVSHQVEGHVKVSSNSLCQGIEALWCVILPSGLIPQSS